MQQKQRFKVGDVIVSGEIKRKITEVRETGYTWIYPESESGEDFLSENSNDPFFEWWVVKHENK